MDILGLKRKALGHVCRDNWGGSSSNEGGSSTSSSGYGAGSTGGGGGSSLGNISPGSSISPESQATYGGSSVADTEITTTPERTPTAADYASGGPSTGTGLNGGGGAPNGGGSGFWSSVFSKQNLKSGLIVMKGGALVEAAAVNPLAAVLGAIAGYVSGEWESVKFSMGSPAPSTSVASASGAGQAMTAWNGGSVFRTGGESRTSSGSPIIGWQGTVVNQAPATKPATLTAPGDYLGFSLVQPTIKPALQAPAGATGGAAESNTTGLVGLAIGLGLLAVIG